MSEQTITSKLLTAVRNIFGRKDDTTGTATTATKPAEDTDTAATREETAEAATESAEAPDTAADLVDPGEKEAIAAELNDNDTETLTAESPAYEEAKAAASAAVAAEGGKAEEPAGEKADDAPAVGTAEELPVPNYGTLTLASVRARLRKLTIEQVRQLRAYEVDNANRPEFIKMYDNRIAKLENEG